MAPTMRYGYTGAYGDGNYKGATEDYPGSLAGLSDSTYKRCFHYGMDDEQGAGWDEVSGADWVWPQSQGAVLNVFDESGQMLLLVWDEKTALPYIVNPRDGPANSGITLVFKDKVDPNVTDSGTDITTSFKLPEHFGEERRYDIEHQESVIQFRPSDQSNKDASGYDSMGLPTGFEADFDIYKDGSDSSSVTMEDIPISYETVVERPVKANTNQAKISTNMAEYRVAKVESKYRIVDKQTIQNSSGMTEASYELEFATPTIWLSRHPDNLLLNRYDGSTIDGTVTGVTGPDSRTESAMRITDSIDVGNSLIAAGTIVLWHSSGYTITGVSLTAVGTSGTWTCSYVTGAIPAGIDLGAGDVFDFRLFGSTLSAAAITHYYNDIVNNSGRIYLPVF